MKERIRAFLTVSATICELVVVVIPVIIVFQYVLFVSVRLCLFW